MQTSLPFCQVRLCLKNPALAPRHHHPGSSGTCHSKFQLQNQLHNTVTQSTLNCHACTTIVTVQGHGHKCSCSASIPVTQVAFCINCHPQHRTAWLQPRISPHSTPRLASHPSPLTAMPTSQPVCMTSTWTLQNPTQTRCTTPWASLCCKQPARKPNVPSFRRALVCLVSVLTKNT